jgi:subtilisin family serine protease
VNCPSLRKVGSALLSALLSLSLCAGPALAATNNQPRRHSLEYGLSWGVAASRATPAYRKGATGGGVVVAMIDTGLGTTPAEMFDNVSPASTDLVLDRHLDLGDHRHGEQTASLLAARLDGTGTFGIAYDATLLSIRADRDGSCLRTCAFDAPVLARAIDYAVENGARVIGMPMASHRRIAAIEPALERAVARGVVIVAAAGNDGGDQPVWPARYAADPRFARSMLVAGATTIRGRFAQWSNKAGVASNRYLAAPGEQVVVDCGQRSCQLTSGTSYSVAYVAGAVAILMSRAPGLQGPDAADALLRNTSDLADRGADPLTGRGRLDVGRALRALDRTGRVRAEAAQGRPSEGPIA